jgi:hypothetical protein
VASPETFGYTLVFFVSAVTVLHCKLSRFCYRVDYSKVEIIFVSDTVLGYGLNDRRFQSLQRLGTFHYRVQTGCDVHTAPYTTGTRDRSVGVKWPVREADHSPPSSAEIKESVEAIPPLPNTPSWRSAQLKKSL